MDFVKQKIEENQSLSEWSDPGTGCGWRDFVDNFLDYRYLDNYPRQEFANQSLAKDHSLMKNIRKTTFALIAVSLTIGYIWYGKRSVTPQKADWDDVRVAAIQGDYRLISTDQLWQRYKSNPENMLLVDTRQAWEYRSGHIQGAVNFPMEPTWLSRWRKKGDLETFLGPDTNRAIVFY